MLVLYTADNSKLKSKLPDDGRLQSGGATASPHATRRSRVRGPQYRHTTPRVLLTRRSSAVFMEKPPPIVEGQHMQTLHPAEQQWVGSHQQQPTAQAVQHHGSSMITDEIRFSIIDAVYLRPGIWDCQREKTVGPSRKELFAEVTTLINQQNQLDPELTPEEVEKQWKNLKDTYVKTRKKLSYNSDSMPVTPKWKFYSSLMFLDDLFSVHRTNLKRRIDDVSGPSQATYSVLVTKWKNT
ncbi:hypothetical protein DICVIV_10167 [Dictyocaulus viviparus]|uniref:MADF domain-containing protein n=1 Tax=Dictyocaulus viviparus TaxID=29172 RepID=A0A0D8XGP0_DICVI|nr:hypothetical protein DICVIV_10167 [Dictyocaulus viviparus]